MERHARMRPSIVCTRHSSSFALGLLPLSWVLCGALRVATPSDPTRIVDAWIRLFIVYFSSFFYRHICKCVYDTVEHRVGGRGSKLYHVHRVYRTMQSGVLYCMMCKVCLFTSLCCSTIVVEGMLTADTIFILCVSLFQILPLQYVAGRALLCLVCIIQPHYLIIA